MLLQKIYNRVFNQKSEVSSVVPESMDTFQKGTYDSCSKHYKMDTFDEINAIPIPTCSFEYNCDFTDSIEYVLQRKATSFKRAGNMECAIACLKKAVEIMKYAPMSYTRDDYKKLEKYLESVGRFEEAHLYKERADSLFAQQKDILIKRIFEDAKSLGTDLLEAPDITPASELEAKYRKRIYSISGSDTRFSKLPSDIFDTRLMLFPILYGISFPIWCEFSKEIEYSNRPFIDDRTDQEKAEYNKIIQKIEETQRAEIEYSWILEHLPEIAPKSLGGYSRMKNANSKNYQIIKQQAYDLGYDIS